MRRKVYFTLQSEGTVQKRGGRSRMQLVTWCQQSGDREMSPGGEPIFTILFNIGCQPMEGDCPHSGWVLTPDKPIWPHTQPPQEPVS